MPVLTVFRHEMKYLLSWDRALLLQNKLDKLLKRDPHSETGAYMVRSLYFDSINHIDFSTKLAGTEIRKKIRLRTYSPEASVCKLEMKQKNGNQQYKISLLISRDAAQRLARGEYNALAQYFDDSPAAIQIYTTMVLGCYRPVELVEYHRIAYIYDQYSTRISFDMNVCSCETCFDLFRNEPMYVPIGNEEVILEVKFNGKLMGFISDVLKDY